MEGEVSGTVSGTGTGLNDKDLAADKLFFAYLIKAYDAFLSGDDDRGAIVARTRSDSGRHPSSAGQGQGGGRGRGAGKPQAADHGERRL